MILATKSFTMLAPSLLLKRWQLGNDRIGEGVLARPGSWSMAKVWDGPAGNLRKPVLSVKISRNGGRMQRMPLARKVIYDLEVVRNRWRSVPTKPQHRTPGKTRNPPAACPSDKPQGVSLTDSCGSSPVSLALDHSTSREQAERIQSARASRGLENRDQLLRHQPRFP